MAYSVEESGWVPNTCNNHFLVINVPIATERLSIEDMRAMRLAQYESFRALLLKSFGDSFDKFISHQDAYTVQDIFESIEKIIQRAKNEVLHVVINGDGTPEGIAIGTNKEHCNLDKLVNGIEYTLTRYNQTGGGNISKIYIIFAQSYGHLVSQTTHSGVSVTALSFPERPTTSSMFRLGKHTDAMHVQLNQYAKHVICRIRAQCFSPMEIEEQSVEEFQQVLEKNIDHRKEIMQAMTLRKMKHIVQACGVDDSDVAEVAQHLIDDELCQLTFNATSDLESDGVESESIALRQELSSMKDYSILILRAADNVGSMDYLCTKFVDAVWKHDKRIVKKQKATSVAEVTAAVNEFFVNEAIKAFEYVVVFDDLCCGAQTNDDSKLVNAVMDRWNNRPILLTNFPTGLTVVLGQNWINVTVVHHLGMMNDSASSEMSCRQICVNEIDPTCQRCDGDESKSADSLQNATLTTEVERLHISELNSVTSTVQELYEYSVKEARDRRVFMEIFAKEIQSGCLEYADEPQIEHTMDLISHLNTVTLDQFHAQYVKIVDGRKACAENIVYKILRADMPQADEQDIKDYVRAIIYKGYDYQYNGPTDDRMNCEDMRSAVVFFQNNCRFLLISALNSKRDSVDEILDSEKRNMQYKSFIEKLFGAALKTDGRDIDKVFSFADVNSKEELQEEVKRFFESENCDIFEVTVVFNGHGTVEGLLDLEKHECHPYHDFVKHIDKYWSECKKRRQSIYPVDVIVVFAQCFGHVLAQDISEVADCLIVPLTSKEKPKTSSIYIPTKLWKCDHLIPFHIQLNQYGRKVEERYTALYENISSGILHRQ